MTCAFGSCWLRKRLDPIISPKLTQMAWQAAKSQTGRDCLNKRPFSSTFLHVHSSSFMLKFSSCPTFLLHFPLALSRSRKMWPVGYWHCYRPVLLMPKPLRLGRVFVRNFSTMLSCMAIGSIWTCYIFFCWGKICWLSSFFPKNPHLRFGNLEKWCWFLVGNSWGTFDKGPMLSQLTPWS